MDIRHPREGDVLPIPFEFQSFDPKWVWVYGNAVLIGGGIHDIVILLRIVRWAEMPPTWIHRLLKHALAECKERGYRRFMVYLESEVYEEQQLALIAMKYGARFVPFKGDLCMGDF